MSYNKNEIIREIVNDFFADSDESTIRKFAWGTKVYNEFQNHRIVRIEGQILIYDHKLLNEVYQSYDQILNIVKDDLNKSWPTCLTCKCEISPDKATCLWCSRCFDGKVFKEAEECQSCLHKESNVEKGIKGLKCFFI